MLLKENLSYLADLHIHSRYSRATSPECTLEGLHCWAQRKGVRLVGTGDCTHPAWFQELHEKLIPSAPGLFRLKPDLAAPLDELVPDACRAPVDFMITGEISSIYKRAGRTRKVHNLVFLPSLEKTAVFNSRLDKLGNIRSDGRPIMGLDSRDLLSILLDVCPEGFLAPAHIWTPWFSMLGSKSGFDSVFECFGELAEHVFAVETGLSSDPPMNWRVSSLDKLALLSNSDLHSPANLGRNANIFHGEPDFFAIRNGLSSRDPQHCGGTIDMFPEEGKYHADGHRKCGICLEPELSVKQNNLCNVCGQPLVLGVLHRVVELADRPSGFKPKNALPCEHIIPLSELLAELLGCKAGAAKVKTAYAKLLAKHGPELNVLRNLPLEQLENEQPVLLAEAIRRARAEQVIRSPGYDGEYGEIRVFQAGEKDALLKQGVFFNMLPQEPEARKRTKKRKQNTALSDSAHPMIAHDSTACPEYAQSTADTFSSGSELASGLEWLGKLTKAQFQAVQAGPAPLLIVAGPGSGKTRVLAARCAWLMRSKHIAPQNILAVTFTNRAARELHERIAGLVPELESRHAPVVSTFHSLAINILRSFPKESELPSGFRLIAQDDEQVLLQNTARLSAREAATILTRAARQRNRLESVLELPGMKEHVEALAKGNWLPLDEITPCAVRLLRNNPEIREKLGFLWVCVDEYQDINHAQYELIRLLAPQGKNLTAIGDPDQAIYGFRGSDVSCFHNFVKDFPDAQTVKLNINFRSSGAIVETSARIIQSGRSSLSVIAKPAAEAGIKIRMHEAASAAAEAEFIAHEIEKWLGGTAQFSMDSGRVDRTTASDTAGLGDMAVLVRQRSLIPSLAAAFSRLGLPVQTVEDKPLLQQPGGREFIAALQTMSANNPNNTAASALLKIKKAGTLSLPAQKHLEEYLLSASASNHLLCRFLDNLMLRQPIDQYDAKAEKVTILTMHASKGLEFPVVFVAGCEGGIIPLTHARQASDIAEEQRLFYVAITRACRALYLTWSRKRMLFGKLHIQTPSPFLGNIPKPLQQKMKMPPIRKRPSQNQIEFNFTF